MSKYEVERVNITKHNVNYDHITSCVYSLLIPVHKALNKGAIQSAPV